MEISLQNKVALVCGASKGIGRETALAFAKAGARVIALSRSEDALQKLISELPGDGHSYIAQDISDIETLKENLKEKLQHYENIHVLVCNSGGPKGGPLMAADSEEFIKGMQGHLVANHTMIKMLVPGMEKEGYGRVINVISTSVKIPIPNLGVSNTVRGAVASFSKTLANELGPKNITVNNVLPGFTATERLDSLKEAAGKRLGKTVSEVEEMWKGQVPLRRFANPEETAAAVLFLSSPLAGYINGVSLPVDGGRLGCI